MARFAREESDLKSTLDFYKRGSLCSQKGLLQSNYCTISHLRSFLVHFRSSSGQSGHFRLVNDHFQSFMVTSGQFVVTRNPVSAPAAPDLLARPAGG